MALLLVRFCAVAYLLAAVDDGLGALGVALEFQALGPDGKGGCVVGHGEDGGFGLRFRLGRRFLDAGDGDGD